MTNRAGLPNSARNRESNSYVIGTTKVRFNLVIGSLLCAVTQGVAFLIFLRRRELQMEGGILVYVVTFLISLPWLIAVKAYRQVRRKLSKTGVDENTLLFVLYLIIHVTGAAYLFLLFSQLLLLSELSLR